MSNTSSLYPLETLPFTSREFHTKFTNLVGPLSLFDPEDNADTGNENPEVKRPLTPIEDAIKGLPSSFSTFAKLVHPRLCPREGITGLSVNDQQQLIGVLMSELNSVWQDVQRGPPDPFLTPQQNRELQRRLTIEIVVIAQGLFAKYLDKAQKLNQRGVFSGPANLSRLKTQLALDASKSLNVLSLRRNLSADMKHPSDASTISSRFSINRTLQAPQNIYKPLVVRQENERKAQSNLTREEKEQLWVDKEINDLQRRMPRVEPIPFMAAIAQNVLRPRKQVSDPHSVIEDRDMEQGPTTARIRFLQKEKFPSVPELFSRETVQEELGIPIIVDEQERAMRRTKSASHVMDERKLRQPYHSAETTSKKLIIADRTSEDLIRLTSRSLKPMGTLQEENDGDDLPPLLQALARYSTTKKDKTTRRMNESGGTKDEDDDAASTTSTVQSTEASSAAVNPSVLDENITEFTGEDHPQPATVSLRLPNKSVVRASDVRVSNRVNKASVTVTKFPTVYNDLSGEIDAPTVKWLDRNLFIGEEIKEVYEEIIKTIGADHLLFDQDEYVEKSTSAVDVTISTASSSLEKPRSERIINKNLKKAGPPPWGKDTADNWRNSPKFGGLGREDILQAKLKKNEEENQTQKSYNSWLAWWRSTITKDDFLKYLSTQENDYMSLMFHLYDSDHESDVEEDDDDARPDTLHMALLRERERKLTELKTLKNDYHPGLWNVNSVLLGGLGNDPEVNDDELRVNVETTRPTATQSATTVSAQSLLLSSGQRSVASGSEISADTATLKIAGNDAPHTSSIAPARTLSSASEDASLSVQDRLERVWTLLCMPDGQRLDMAIKYSSEPYSNRLMESITLWEAATEVVLERERLMTKLEDFERTASDPNRFFIKGFPGSSASRIRESKTRDWFNKRLSQIDSDARKSVTEVSRQFGDTVTFQGRPYLEKMSVDRTEMFYWLQQERRQQVFEKEFVKVKELTLKPTDLPPIEAHTLL